MVLPKFVSLWQSISGRHMIWLVSLITRRWIMVSWIAGSEMVTRMVLPTYSISTTLTSRTPTSYRSTVPAAHEPGTRPILLQRRLLSSGHFRARVVAPSLNISPRSPVSVLRPPWACRRFLLRPAAEPMTYSGRPPRPRPHRCYFSAVRSRDASSLLTHSERHHSNNYV